MGGPRGPIGAKIMGERIVHVDSPKIVKKYEAIAQDAADAANKLVEAAVYETNNLRTEYLALEKKLAQVEAERLRVSNLKVDVTAAPAVTPDSKEVDRLTQEASRLREALRASNDLVLQLKMNLPAPLKVTDTVRVVEYQDRIVTRTDKKLAALATALALTLGVPAGYYAKSVQKPASVQSPSSAPTPQPSPSPLPTKKAQVKK